MDTLEKLKYPIGKFTLPQSVSNDNIETYILTISEFPQRVEQGVKNLSPQELNYKYRPEGWTILQVINHCVDSHNNSFIRFKLALTEENPTIKPYNETRWGELPDSLMYPVEDSLVLLKSFHKRWVYLLKNLSKEDFKKTFFHPELSKKIRLDQNLSLYHWHCNHHLAHIVNAKKLKF